MRKVKYVTKGWFGPECKNVGPVKYGWFHGFFAESDSDGTSPVAIVESATGECVTLSVKQIKFLSEKTIFGICPNWVDGAECAWFGEEADCGSQPCEEVKDRALKGAIVP